jgi:hypothetical protein
MHKFILILTFILASAGLCSWSEERTVNGNDWVVINVKGVFDISVPPDTIDQKLRGIDSVAGRFKGTGFELSYDYGRYSDPLDGKRYRRAEEKIDERACFVATADGFAGIYFPVIYVWDPTVKLEIGLKLVGMDKDTALRMLRSVRFPLELTQKSPVKREGSTEGKNAARQ